MLFALFWLEIPYKFRRFHVQILLNDPLLSMARYQCQNYLCPNIMKSILKLKCLS